MFSKGRAVRRFVFLALIFGLYTPLYAFSLKVWPKKREKLKRWSYSLILKVLGIHLNIRGRPSEELSLIVANHSSYLDILILGSVLSGNFVAKKEVSTWPLIGWIARKQGTVFIQRHPRGVPQELKSLHQSLAQKDNLILFPEGTSNDGCRVLPFYSSFFQVVEKKPGIQVQPVTLSYTHLDGLPMSRQLKQMYSWTGAVDFFPHLWLICQLGCVTARLAFHEPFNPKDFTSRKELSLAAWEVIQKGLDNMTRP